MSQNNILRPTLFLLFFMAFFSGFVFSDGFVPGLENPLLRDHFRRQQIRVLSYVDLDGQEYVPGSDPFLEQRVDWLIETFLKQVSKKLDALKAHFNRAQQARAETLGLGVTEKAGQKAQARWRKSLRAVSDQAKDLRQTLHYVLVGLPSKCDFRPQIQDYADNPGFKIETRFLEDQITKAERQINDYFFVPTHTVKIEELQRANMMIHLHRVEKISKQLSIELPARLAAARAQAVSRSE